MKAVKAVQVRCLNACYSNVLSRALHPFEMGLFGVMNVVPMRSVKIYPSLNACAAWC